MTRFRRQSRPTRRSMEIVGVVAICALAAMLYISASAQNGLPWQARYHINVDFPNAVRLARTDTVDIGGNPVGAVSSVTPLPARDGKPAYVRVALALDPSVGRLPVDTRTRILDSSVLGQTYVDLMPGASSRKVPAGGTLPLANAESTVQLTDLFDIFNSATARDVQRTLRGVAGGLAGRGADLNSTIGSLSALLPAMTNVSRKLASPSANLGGFLSAYDSFADALAPVASTLGDLVGSGSQTFGAISSVRPALARTIAALPSTENAVTTALTNVRPALDELANVAVALTPAGRLLPTTVQKIDGVFAAGVTPLRELPAFASRLRGTLTTLKDVAQRTSTDRAVVKLTDTINAANPTVSTLEQGQAYCNMITTFLMDYAHGAANNGIGVGPPIWVFDFTQFGAQGELLQQGKPSSNVDINYYPTENASQCVSGNEPANAVTQSFNNPTVNVGTRHWSTLAPPAATALAQEAGLLKPPQGWTP